jgi:proteic killer suppression protein
MLEIVVTEEFEKRYKELPATIQKKAEKQEKLFRLNPFHPSLHTEKLEPKGRQVWSFRIDRKYRIIFRFIEGKKVIFLTVGPHDWIYKITP